MAGVTLVDGADADATQSELQALTKGTSAQLLDVAGYQDEITAQTDAMMGIVYALAALSILIAGLGIANTLSLAIAERTREIGLLCATGATRSQIMTMVIAESIVTSVIGGAAGVGAGLGGGFLLVQGVDGLTFAVDAVQVALLVAIALVLGFVASLIPAARASRINVLHAIAAA